MSSFPRTYAESTLKRMYKKLTISDDTVKLLHQYFVAYSNFYNLIPLKLAYDIFCQQNDEIVSQEEFIAFSEIARHEDHFYFILGDDELYTNAPKVEPFNRSIVHESLIVVDYDFFYKLADAKLDKPYFIPIKSELLKHSDDNYVEENKYFNAAVDFFINDMKKQHEVAWNIAAEMMLFVRNEHFDLKGLMNYLEWFKISFTTNQLKKFVPLYQDLHNNTTTPYNNGFSPNELRKQVGASKSAPIISFGPNMTAGIKNGDVEMIKAAQSMAGLAVLSDAAVDLLRNNTIMQHSTERNVSRNQLCPCGSGKKYKRCCGK